MQREDATLNIERFYTQVKKHLKDGVIYSDAVQLAAVIIGGETARLVSSAVNKYQEAIYEKTELSKQPNVDECALASMGKLWHGEHFEGSTAQMECTEEEIFLDALYFVLKYADKQEPLKDALAANETVCGDKEARKRIIKMAYDAK